MPVRESFELTGRIYDLDRAAYKRNRDRLAETLEIADLMNTPVRMLSLGQRVRCDLALTFLDDPAIAFLDEPTIGLDIFAREKVRSFLRQEKKRSSSGPCGPRFTAARPRSPV